MTTNVYDSNVGLMATDSRWSYEYGKYVVYVDDTRFEKIERLNDAAFMFAGDGVRIQSWKTWIRSNPPDFSGMPQPEGICICIARISTKEVLFDERQDIVNDGGYFAGTGSLYAYRCWSGNKCAKRAVDSAKMFDKTSGGDVKFFDLGSGEHNLFSPTKDVHIDDVRRAMNDRGMVMEIAVNNEKGVPFRLKEGAANDEALRDIQGKIASGEIAPTAPCDGMYNEWTDGQKSKLKAVLGEVFGWKK